MGPILGALMLGGSLLGSAVMAGQNRRNRDDMAANDRQNRADTEEFGDNNSDRYDQSAARATGGANLYADATGLNGADGYGRAQSAFQTSPGYDFAVDQALQAVNRSAAAGGMLASGNTMDAAMQQAMGYANREYQGWLGNLGGWVGAEQAALDSQVGIDAAILNARTGLNNAANNQLQSQINARTQTMGNLLNFGANVAGRAFT